MTKSAFFNLVYVIKGNRLTILPPELGLLDLIGNKQVLRLEHNPWVQSIQVCASELLAKSDVSVVKI